MARYNEILVGRFNRGLQKLFGMKGEVPTPQLSSEVSVAFPLFSGAEFRYLEGWERFGLSVAVGPTAAQFATLRLRNPTASNVIAVIESLQFVTSLADQVNVSRQSIGTDLTTVQVLGNQRVDSRQRPTPTLVSSVQTQVASTDLTSLQGLLASNTANTIVQFVGTDIQEIPILPGDAVQVTAQVANSKIALGWLWRERFLEESERT